MSTLLVTGGSGFIGSHFIKGFLKSHPAWKVLNFDKLTYCGNRENTRELENDPRYAFEQADICDAALAGAAMARADAVIHFAAETHVDRSIDDADDFLITNIVGTRVLLEAARRRGIKRFLQISTDEVYGSVPKGAVDEDAPLRPNSPYSAAKAGADLLVRSYRETYGYPAIIVRSTNNFGPFQFPEKVIPLFMTNLLDGKKVPLYGKGENRRDWIYVDDNCRAIELVFDKGNSGEIYNIGGGNEMSNRELTQRILKKLKRSEDMIELVPDRPGHDFRYAVNTDKIRALGFKPRCSFDEALENTLEWYQTHESWWRPLKRDKFTVK